MNFVMTSAGKFVEVQATAEHQVFDDSELAAMIQLARSGIHTLLEKQQAVLGKLEAPSR
jgi:ribonuclease PH